MALAFNDWANIVKRIPQGSILGLLLFNKFIFVVFFSAKCEFCYFADENLFLWYEFR